MIAEFSNAVYPVSVSDVETAHRVGVGVILMFLCVLAVALNCLRRSAQVVIATVIVGAALVMGLRANAAPTCPTSWERIQICHRGACNTLCVPPDQVTQTIQAMPGRKLAPLQVGHRWRTIILAPQGAPTVWTSIQPVGLRF